MAGIKDVARAAGVSVSTVSYVLSNKRSISAETTRRVMDAIRELDYTPDASAQKMRGVRNSIIALSMPIRGDINLAKYNAYFLRTAWEAKNADYDVLLLTGEDMVGDIQRVTRSNLVDGVVLMDIEEDDERAAKAATYAKPTVAVGYPLSHDGCACIDIDFVQVGCQAADYLYDRGHRNVILLRDNEHDYERRSGYVVMFHESMMDRAEELGMSVLEFSKTDLARFDAVEFVHEMFSDGGMATAIISQAPASVLDHVLKEMQVRGIRVPEDVSVLSCGTFLEGEFMTRPVTEIPVMPELLAHKAVSLLVDSIEGGKSIAGMVDLVSPVIQERGSVMDLTAEGGRGSR
ncbi:LacI family DNA-binding transcriptional regulator [Bifidobacterium oedipodis]|uniref:LacI family transcriptional regulator n=1 Tax=Bifidobacterium oedipodis TaxID=2675322 RepID=A0A7Y0ERW9_9BIFI|nr:LacI family DNA-binding transcriptional regulator [Bifidobacterium sp. DSM 109957]NMM95259.1 LacI family transcriptional regulator [Bifidobacterium sp. DSM 109957]